MLYKSNQGRYLERRGRCFAPNSPFSGGGPWFSETVAQQIKETDNTDLH
jgi:hypothetical protein